MKLNRVPVAVAAAVLLGIAQYYLLLFCWSYIGAYSPVPAWLIDAGLRDFALRAVLLPIDLLTSVLLSFPAAYLLRKLRPRRLRLYLMFAVIPGFIWFNLGRLGNPFLTEYVFALGWVPELFALPVAVCLLRFMPNPPAGSSKRTPLRGAA